MYVIICWGCFKFIPIFWEKNILFYVIHKNTQMIYLTHVLIHIILRVTNIIHITHITYMTHMTYIAHMIKLLFKAYKKSDKIFFDNFFFYI